MRKLTRHIVDGDILGNQLEIRVLDEPGAGGASHRYAIDGFDTTSNDSDTSMPAKTYMDILFQNGPIKEKGVNGLTQEALLAVVADRLESFQAGPFASDYNQFALNHVRSALYWLQERTRERIARQVEGTNVL